MTAAREQYLRLLMALALIGTVTYTATGWTWLPLFPSTGLILAGSAAFVAATARPEGPAGPAVRAGLLRLLAPFWLFAAVAVPVMLTLGWGWSEDLRSVPFEAGTAWLWVLPLSDPPVSTAALSWTALLWAVPTWFWLLLLSPPLLWISRRWPLRLAVLPVAAVLLMSLGLWAGEGRVHDVLVALCVFTCCWLIGFAYADGRLARMPIGSALAVGTGTIGAGWWCWRLQAEQYGADDTAGVPLATLLLSAGAVLLLLRAQPAFTWFGGLRRTNAVLRFLTDRTVTAVLWTGPAVVAAPLVLGTTGAYAVAGRWEPLLELAATWLLLLTVVVLVGWLERLGNRPWRRRSGRTPERTYVFEGNLVAEQQTVGGQD